MIDIDRGCWGYHVQYLKLSQVQGPRNPDELTWRVHIRSSLWQNTGLSNSKSRHDIWEQHRVDCFMFIPWWPRKPSAQKQTTQLTHFFSGLCSFGLLTFVYSDLIFISPIPRDIPKIRKL